MQKVRIETKTPESCEEMTYEIVIGPGLGTDYNLAGDLIFNMLYNKVHSQVYERVFQKMKALEHYDNSRFRR